jgi:hypothetical protein
LDASHMDDMDIRAVIAQIPKIQMSMKLYASFFLHILLYTEISISPNEKDKNDIIIHEKIIASIILFAYKSVAKVERGNYITKK